MYDTVEILVEAGTGGDGAVNFRREKFVPFGGPDGGDGGNGGDVVIVADRSIGSLRIFRQNKIYRAGKGERGKGKKKHGKRGKELELKVPIGTIASLKEIISGDGLVVDLARLGQRVVVARGGKGGLGNTHFVSSTNQAPRLAQKGEPGEKPSILLELRLIADVGIIGYPNVGKSTLLAAASAAKPKVAGYPFTTLEPILGVVEVGQRSFVLAEIPGLIEGAHLGRGLGHEFLRHAMRTKILVHLIDGASVSPVEDMLRVNMELALFDSALAQKPQLVVINKVDLTQVGTRLTEIKDAFSNVGTSGFFISAASGEGIPELMVEVMETLRQVATRVAVTQKIPGTVFRPQPKSTGINVQKEGDSFVLIASELERIVSRVDTASPEIRRQFQSQLARLGANKILERAGVKPGDKVRCGDFEWEW